MTKYFSKRQKSIAPKRFSEVQGIDASVVKTLCSVVDGLQGKVAEMADELASLKEKSSDIVQNASTEEGEPIAEPKADPIQEPQQVPEEVANGVADDKAPEYTNVPEDQIVSQFSNPANKQTEDNTKFLMGQESFNCLFD